MNARNATSSSARLIGVPICPDLLDHSALGEADSLRGRVVRGFFFLMRWWPEGDERTARAVDGGEET